MQPNLFYATILKNIVENNNFSFNANEEVDFNNYVLPKLRMLLNNIDFSKNISDKYNIPWAEYKA